uniref:Immediate early response 3-interacting protein 1 n=1 Tax=Ananas comosus var. bracteatus TaxID=296719 RepID=A0A6V7NI80_ANACO|nr:unnamed protein product [Ananas comosus var. bracteatus]
MGTGGRPVVDFFRPLGGGSGNSGASFPPLMEATELCGFDERESSSEEQGDGKLFFDGLVDAARGFLLIANALAILNEERFLAPRGWSFSEVTSGGRAKTLKGQLIGLIYATQYLRVPLIILNAIIILVKLVSG